MKFLIVKTSSIGDIIQAFPAAAYLKIRFPSAVVDWVVEEEYQGLVQAHPAISHVIPFHSRRLRKDLSALKEIPCFIRKIRKTCYDAVFDLQGNTKSAFITMVAKSADKVGPGWKSVAEFPSFFATNYHVEVNPQLQIQQRYLHVVQRFFNDVKPFTPPEVVLNLSEEEKQQLERLKVHHRPCIMVAAGSRWQNKQLSQETLEELVLAQQETPYFYFVSGSAQETITAEKLHSLVPNRSQVVTSLSFPLWQALMREMDLVIAADSAALALCGTTATPSLSFFGPSLARIYKPLGAQHRAWQGSCPYGLQFKTRCPRLRTCPTGACLKQAKAEEVIAEIGGGFTTERIGRDHDSSA